MPRKKKKNNPAYNGGYIRPTEYGTYRAEIVIDGKQRRKSFSARLEAEGWIDTLRIAQERRERPLSLLETADALAALDLLPAGTTLMDAARCWMSANRTPVVAISAREALDKLIAEKRALDRRQRTAQGYRDAVGKFLRDTVSEATHVHDIGTHQIKTWLSQYSPASWNGYRRTLHAFFAWCHREEFCASNPVEPIPVASVRRDAPVCLPVSDVRAFLDCVAEHDPGLAPYFAVAFFAGIRSAELARMDADCIGSEYIHVGPRHAKVNAQRYVKIVPVLAHWLTMFPPHGALRVDAHRRRFRAIVARIRETHGKKGFEWPRNAARHSFASYHLAAYKDSAATAHELGHTSPNLLFSRYRTLATEADGLAYFSLDPPGI